jgi:hypothetical protein
VQNASTETFGSPTGSTSFAMDLVSTERMAVYQVGAQQTRLRAVLDPTPSAAR